MAVGDTFLSGATSSLPWFQNAQRQDAATQQSQEFQQQQAMRQQQMQQQQQAQQFEQLHMMQQEKAQQEQDQFHNRMDVVKTQLSHQTGPGLRASTDQFVQAGLITPAQGQGYYQASKQMDAQEVEDAKAKGYTPFSPQPLPNPMFMQPGGGPQSQMPAIGMSQPPPYA